MHLFWAYNSDFHGKPLSYSVKVNNKTIQIRCKGFLSSFFHRIYLWFRIWHYHYSNKKTVKSTRITLYTYTIHCIIRTVAQSVRRQHEKRTSEKSKRVTCEDTTEVARNMWIWSIWSTPLGRMGHSMLKWLVIYILNKLALYLYEGELCSKVIERIYNMATNENSGHWFDCHKQKMYAKV